MNRLDLFVSQTVEIPFTFQGKYGILVSDQKLLVDSELKQPRDRQVEGKMIITPFLPRKDNPKKGERYEKSSHRGHPSRTLSRCCQH